MCLTAVFKSKKEALEFKKGVILKKDMVVYKGLIKRKDWPDKKPYFISPYRYFRYDKGQHYYQTGKRGIVAKYTNDSWKEWKEYRITITEGLHSCLKRNQARKHGSSIVEMIIPKGARVWIKQKTGEVASTELIFPHQ